MPVIQSHTKSKIFKVLAFSVSFLLFGSAFASGGSEEHSKKSFNAGEMIMHHIADQHQVHIASFGVNHISIPLPILLLDDGLKFFSANKFYHNPVQISGLTSHAYQYENYVMVDEHIFKVGTDGALSLENGEVSSTALKPFDLSITKSVFGFIITGFLLLLLFVTAARKYKRNKNQAPSGVQTLIESLVLFVRDDIVVPSIGEKKADKFLPFLLTTFFFIWLANMLGLIPFVGGFNIMGTIGVTVILALCVFVITTINGNKGYWMHIFWPPNVPIAIKLILVPIEVFQIFLKPIILMIRLTANITAGHIIILAFVSLIFIFGESSVAGGYGVGAGSLIFMIFMNFIELLVAFLQAYVFTLLAALYFGSAVEEAHH